MTQKWTDLDAEPSRDPHFLDDGLLRLESTELLATLLKTKGAGVSYGDGSLEPMARRVLTSVARQIAEGRTPPPEFLKLLGAAIEQRLQGTRDTLDQALGLTARRGAQHKDPASFDHIVVAFDDAFHASASSQYEVKLKAGFEAAFKAQHGKGRGEFDRLGFDAADIEERAKRTERFLSERGRRIKWTESPRGSLPLSERHSINIVAAPTTHGASMNSTDFKSNAYLRLPEVLKRFPVSKSTWWAGVKAGKFPSPHKLSARCVAWLESDILALIASTAAA